MLGGKLDLVTEHSVIAMVVDHTVVAVGIVVAVVVESLAVVRDDSALVAGTFVVVVG